MFKVDDVVTVVRTDWDDVQPGSRAKVVRVSDNFILAEVDGHVPSDIDLIMCALLNVPDGCLPFKHDELQLA